MKEYLLLKQSTIFKLFLLSALFFPAICVAGLSPLTGIYDKVIAQVRLEGNHYITSASIFASVNFEASANTLVKVEQVRNDIENIYSLGFFKSVNVALKSEKQGQVLIYQLEENPLIKKIVINGISAEDDNFFLEAMNTRPLTVLSYKVIDEDIQRINKKLVDYGYSLNRVSNVEFLTTSNIVLLSIKETKINNVLINGNQRFADNLISREMTARKGRVFNLNEVRKDRDIILGLGYFSSVSAPQLVPVKDTDDIDIVFSVVERKVNSISLALEEGRKSINLTFRNQLVNYLKWGESFSARAQYGEEQLYSLHFYLPWTFNQRVSLGLNKWLQISRESDKNGIDYDVLRNGADIIWGLPLADEIKMYVTYRSENVRENVAVPSIIYTKNDIELAISYENRDSLVKPTNGSYGYAQVSKGGNYGLFDLGGINYVRMSASYMQFYKVRDKQVFAFRNSYGSFSPDQNNIKLLELDLFTIGGASTIRGYTDSTSRRGLHMLTGNYEYRIYLMEALSLVFFYDMGIVYEQEISLSDFIAGRGFGFRFFTPFGPIRLDLAWSNSSDFVLHFGLSEMF